METENIKVLSEKETQELMKKLIKQHGFEEIKKRYGVKCDIPDCNQYSSGYIEMEIDGENKKFYFCNDHELK